MSRAANFIPRRFRLPSKRSLAKAGNREGSLVEHECGHSDAFSEISFQLSQCLEGTKRDLKPRPQQPAAKSFAPDFTATGISKQDVHFLLK
jgi:hypothetical protein